MIEKSIENELLITEEPYISVTMPTVDCILGDKLTAFAPHTTGIPFGFDKELEIIKQMYDIASLIDCCIDFNDIRSSYQATVKAEIAYRGLNIDEEVVLTDTIEAAACIASRGKMGSEYDLYLSGIRSIVQHIYAERFSAERAVPGACKVMYMAACVLKNEIFEKITDPTEYLTVNIGQSKYSKLSKLKKFDPLSFAYVVKAIQILE